jgi:hypothetical protein
MKRTGWIVVSVTLTLGLLLLFLPVWGMGAAVFLDSRRTMVFARSSPDQRRIAQVERLVVGGVPTIVVTVRPSWRPNWYLWSCAAASHYEDTSAKIRWKSPDTLEISSGVDPSDWLIGKAPFHNQSCKGLAVSVVKA